MNKYRSILVLGIIEILIGGITLCGIFGSIVMGINTKSANVLMFVVASATISTLIGIGILQLRIEAYRLLLYFSSVILLSKILIVLDIISLNGALTSFIPEYIRDIVSGLYHAFIIYYLRRPGIKAIFHS